MPSLRNDNVQNWSGLIPTNSKKPDYQYRLRIAYFYRVFANPKTTEVIGVFVWSMSKNLFDSIGQKSLMHQDLNVTDSTGDALYSEKSGRPC